MSTRDALKLAGITHNEQPDLDQVARPIVKRVVGTRFAVVEVDGRFEVQDTQSPNRFCFRNADQAISDGLALHLNTGNAPACKIGKGIGEK